MSRSQAVTVASQRLQRGGMVSISKEQKRALNRAKVRCSNGLGGVLDGWWAPAWAVDLLDAIGYPVLLPYLPVPPPKSSTPSPFFVALFRRVSGDFDLIAAADSVYQLGGPEAVVSWVCDER